MVYVVSHSFANLAQVRAAQCLQLLFAETVTVSAALSTLQVKVISNSTTLIADAANKEDISMRVKQIKKELSETDSVYDTEKLSERIAKLAGGVAVIKVLFATLLLLTPQSTFQVSLRQPVSVCTSHARVVCVTVTFCKTCCMALSCHHSSTSGGFFSLHGLLVTAVTTHAPQVVLYTCGTAS